MGSRKLAASDLRCPLPLSAWELSADVCGLFELVVPWVWWSVPEGAADLLESL